MSTVGNFFATHWRKLAGIAVGALVVIPALTPFAVPIIGLGTLIIGNDFQVGSKVGTPIGAGAKRVFSTKDIAALTPEELQALGDAARLLHPPTP